jgi:molybdenum cofactor cytidylyltransferase
LSPLRDGGCDDIVVVVGAADVPPPCGAEMITAPDWAAGLSASLRTGLARADRMGADYAVVHVIDTPDVAAAVTTRVLHRALASPSGLVRAYFGNRPGHPVVLVRPRWSGVLTAITGDRGAGAYLDSRDDVERVDCGDLAVGADIDEPA